MRMRVRVRVWAKLRVSESRATYLPNFTSSFTHVRQEVYELSQGEQMGK